MCVRVFLCCVVLCVGRGLASGRSPVQGVLPNFQIDHKFQKLNSESEQAMMVYLEVHDDDDDDDSIMYDKVFL
jgi:hypothetical protein